MSPGPCNTEVQDEGLENPQEILAFLRAFALHMYRKVSRRYKVEPLV